MSIVKAELKVLTEAQISQTHDVALTILEKTGVRVDDENARNIFRKKIGSTAGGNTVRIPREITQWAIASAPSRIDVLRRDGNPGFTLDSQKTDGAIFGIGVTNLYYQDVLTDKAVTFGRNHMVQATRLGDALDEFDTISTPGVIQDCPSEAAEQIGFLEMLANTKKPLTLLISEPKTFEQCLAMCDVLAGENATRSSILPYFNPITPLILNQETTVKIDTTVSRGMPFIFSNYGMSGATCPITPGGTLALLMAELLAGLIYSQLLKDPLANSKIWPFLSLDAWQSQDCPKAGNDLRRYTQELLDNLQCPEYHDDILSKGSKFIKSLSL